MTEKTQLYPHEWMAIMVIASAMGILTLIAQTNWVRPLPADVAPHYIVDQTIVVFVEGAVEFPGRYEFQKGAKIEEVLELVKPFPGAKPLRYRPEAKLRDGQVIRIKAPREKGQQGRKGLKGQQGRRDAKDSKDGKDSSDNKGQQGQLL
jgi:hypothetical protein